MRVSSPSHSVQITWSMLTLKNNIILLMGIAGSGKMTIGEAIVKQNPNFKLVTPDSLTLDEQVSAFGEKNKLLLYTSRVR